MSSKLLTFELKNSNEEIEIHGDAEGLQELIQCLSRLVKTSSRQANSHEHLMTPAWGGDELTGEIQSEDSTLINKVTIHLWR